MLRSTPSLRSQNPRLEGWMYKKTKGVKGLRYFQRRWVVLYPDSCVIAYYKKRDDYDKEHCVRNNVHTSIMPWAAAGIIPIDNIESVYPTHKDTRFDIAVSLRVGKSTGKTYQWKCKTKLQRDLWVEAIALVHEQLQKSHLVVTINELDDAPEDVVGRGEGSESNGQGSGSAATSGTSGTTGIKYPEPPFPLRESTASSTRSSTTSSTRRVVHTKQGSEVIGRLLTTDRFAPLRPPPSVSDAMEDAMAPPTMSNTVGRSLIGADHMPHSGESAMSDSDTNDECDTDETDPEDDAYPDIVLEVVAEEEKKEKEQQSALLPIGERSGTLIVDHAMLDVNDRKHALRLHSIESIEGKHLVMDVQVGWMWKLGRINKSWRKRYFVVTHGQLRYYTNSTRSELKGTMPLLATEISVIDATVFKPPTGMLWCCYCL